MKPFPDCCETAQPERPTAPAPKPEAAVEAIREEVAGPAAEEKPATPPPVSKTTTPPAQQETQKFVVPLMAGARLVIYYPIRMHDCEKDMVESAFAMIRDTIRAE